MTTPTEDGPVEDDGSGSMRKVARAGGFVLYCVLVVEVLLWLASATIPSVGLRLANRRGEPRFLPHETLGLVGNPAWAEHDRRGFRNEKALESAQIVTLGDSQTHGVNVRSEQTWPKHLQRMLGVPVYNMAVSGTGPAYYHYLVKDALDLSPTWALTGFYSGNDLWNSVHDYYLREFPNLDPEVPRDPERRREVEERMHFLTASYRQAAKLLEFRPPRETTGKAHDGGSGLLTFPSRVEDFLRDNSKLWGVARAIRAGIRARLETETTESGEKVSRRHWEQLVEKAKIDPGVIIYETPQTRTTLHPGHRIHGVDVDAYPLLEEGLEISLEALQKIDFSVREQGALHLVVLIPSKEYVHAPFLEFEEGEDTTLSRLVAGEKEIWERTKNYLEAEGIEYVDTTPALRQAVERGIQVYPYSTQSHPNAKGYETIANAVAVVLETNGF